jgi:TPR repeat protein
MKFNRVFLTLLFTLVLSGGVFGQEDHIPRRVALVIGNTEYKVGRLTNPKNDARDLGEALEKVGFEVTTKYDLTKFEMEEAVDNVTEGLKQGDAVLIFFSGHGLEIKHANYLVPIGAKYTREFHIRQRSVDADYLLSAMEESGASLRIMILDACRTSPFRSFSKNLSSGLAPVDAPDVTIIAYATAPGATASDGRGNNSPFTKHLVKTLESHPPQGLEINNMFMTVARAVKKETGQRAYVNNDASMDQFFIKPVILPTKPEGTEKLEPLDNYRDVDIATVTQHAEYGFAEAQAQLGYMFSNGIQVKQDYSAAVRWARRAVRSGSARAMNNLGYYFGEGRGIEKDSDRAVELYRLSAANGYPLAKRNMGVMNRDGKGVPQDGKLAIEWFTEAALAPPSYPEDPTAKFAERDLGFIYQHGKAGIKKDYKKALAWYRKSAARGYADAQVKLGSMYENGRGVKKDFETAAEWYTKAAEQKYPSGLYCLGRMFQYGKGVEQDYQLARGLYLRSAELGYSEAQHALGYLYDKGIGLSEDNVEAMKWYLKAAQNGKSGSQVNIGLMYDNGDGVEQSYKKALDWYRKAANGGNASAQVNLGFMYAKGNGVSQNRKEANRLYRLAAKQGSVDGQWNLADNYEHGNGTKKDLKKALYWYKKAAAQGDKEAKAKVRELEDE